MNPKTAPLLLKDFSSILFREWHPSKNPNLNPETVTASSNRKVFWLGKCGHEWEAVVASRTRIGSGCPFCANQKVLRGFNDLLTQRPDLAKEWSIADNALRPDEVLAGGNTKYVWACNYGHRYQSSVYQRIQGSSCDVCSGKRLLAGFNDLETRFPHIASEWNENLNKKPAKDVLPSSTVQAHWTCPIGHEYEQSPSKRVGKRGASCPYCSSQSLLSGFNDLATVRPELALMWDFKSNLETPERVFAYAKKEYVWRCDEDHTWTSKPSSMKGSCPFCCNQKVWPGFNDLQTLRPELAEEWDSAANHEEASQVSACGRQKAHWVCARGHKWVSAKYSRCAGSGCPYCSNKSSLPAPGHDLGSLFPELLKEWDYGRNTRSPHEVFPSSAESIHWRCSLGHAYTVSPNSRVKRDGSRTGCPTCSGRTILSGFNDLASQSPRLAMEWHVEKNAPIRATEVGAKAKGSYWWRCAEGHEWIAAIYSRDAGNGCPQCAQFGFKPSSPALLYFIENPALSARKIGITNSSNRGSRVSRFEFKGWRVVHTVEHQSGSLIRELERLTLQKWIRMELGLPVKLAKSDMGGIGGETETFSFSGPSNTEVIEKIDSLFSQLCR